MRTPDWHEQTHDHTAPGEHRKQMVVSHAFEKDRATINRVKTHETYWTIWKSDYF